MSFFEPMLQLSLRPYQEEIIEEIRRLFKQRNRRIVVSAPTGAGKTELATALIQRTVAKGGRALFLADRITLVQQTSDRLRQYGIRHGVAQGDNSHSLVSKVIVASAQSLQRITRMKKDEYREFNLIVIDECHVLHKSVLEYLESYDPRCIGLTATPYKQGLGRVFTGLVSTTSTQDLIKMGYLCPLDIYRATEIDVEGVPTVGADGEWNQKAMGQHILNESLCVTGDILIEFTKRKQKIFPDRMPSTLVFSFNVEHGKSICDSFNEVGYNAMHVSYLTPEDEKNRIIDAFRRREIDVLISCEMLTRGFDVPHVEFLIIARPYRKSLSSVIQMLGRGMRASPGKERCIVNDHSGNYVRFYLPLTQHFISGPQRLDDGFLEDKPPRDKKPPSEIFCSECEKLLPPKADNCPACGHAIDRLANIDMRSGRMEKAISYDGKRFVGGRWVDNTSILWQQCCVLAYRSRPLEDEQSQIRLARSIYVAAREQITSIKEWPPSNWSFDPFYEPEASLIQIDADRRRAYQQHLRRLKARSKKASKAS